MTLFQVLNLAAMLACFGSFTWAIKRFFRVEGQQGGGMKAISALGTVFVLIHAASLVYFGTPWTGTAAAALGIYATSFLVFWSTVRANRQAPLTLAYTEDEPQHLVTRGPYRWVRHPFYTSYTLAWIAGCLASSFWPLGATVVVMFALYYRAATHEELKFERSPLADEYARYVQRTGRFFPRP